MSQLIDGMALLKSIEQAVVDEERIMDKAVAKREFGTAFVGNWKVIAYRQVAQFVTQMMQDTPDG